MIQQPLFWLYIQMKDLKRNYTPVLTAAFTSQKIEAIQMPIDGRMGKQNAIAYNRIFKKKGRKFYAAAWTSCIHRSRKWNDSCSGLEEAGGGVGKFTFNRYNYWERKKF